MPDDIPSELQALIERCFPSLGHLEAICLLHRSPDRGWSIQEVARELYIAAEMTNHQLQDLTRHGFLQFDSGADTFRYAPQTAEVAASLDALVKLYQERRVTVISLIYSKPVNNVQTFADAFRLRKEN